MSDLFADYRDVLGPAMREASLRVFGDAEQVEREASMRSLLESYRERPIDYVREVLTSREHLNRRAVTWPGSRGILRALRERKRVHVCGCRRSGKSHASGQAVNWFFDSGPCRIIITSATYTQVRENLFARIRSLRMHAPRPLPGRLGVTSLRHHEDPNWYAIGISTNKPGNMQGFHSDVSLNPMLEYDEAPIDEESLVLPDPEAEEADLRRSEKDAGEVLDEEVWRAKKDQARLLFVLDEMAEMRPDIVETMAGSWMGPDVYVLSQFNPTFLPESGHPAARFLRPESGFFRVHIAGREPPPELEHPTGLFDACYHGVPDVLMPDAWVSERLADWGEQSALTCCHVYGLPASIDRERQFIPFRLLRLGFDRVVPDTGRGVDRRIGWDVAASSSGDFNVVSLWVNGRLTAQEKWHHPDPIESAERVLALRLKWSPPGSPIPGYRVKVDKGGVGAGAIGYMRQKGCYVDAVDFGSAPAADWLSLTGETRFVPNGGRKAELLWILRRGLQEGIWSIPRDFPEVIKQAQWHTFVERPSAAGTALAVAESKDELRKLYQKSPDELDSALIALSDVAADRRIRTFTDVSEIRAAYR